MKKIFIILFSLLVGCGAKNTESSPGVMIQIVGNHHVSKSLKLSVTETPEHKINGFLFDENGRLLIQDLVNANIYERWFYYWEDKSQKLWFWSTDKGGHYWVKDLHSSYQRRSIASTDAKELPEEYWNSLPSTIQNSWKSNR